MTDRPADFCQAIKAAIMQHYSGNVAPDGAIECPLDEVLNGLIYVAVEIGMTAPPGPHRESVLNYLGELLVASEIAIGAGISVAAAMAGMRGEKPH